MIIFLAASSLAISHILANYFEVKLQKKVEILQSLSAGFSVAYVFLIIFPEIGVQQISGNVDGILAALIGFIFFHVTLKFIFRKNHEKHLEVYADWIHIIMNAFFNFLITFSVIELLQISISQGTILLIIILIHSSLTEITHPIRYSNLQTPKLIIISAATILGALAASLGIIDQTISGLLFAFTSGAIIYVSIREEIPQGSKGNPFLFVAGSVVMIITFLIFFN
ncbi:MAG TPA: hypothetical protein VGA67_05815 [Candidatus Dojkabacteria bacterium]|jgi:zinc transporter ZupT